jgi:hypothetical protein
VAKYKKHQNPKNKTQKKRKTKKQIRRRKKTWPRIYLGA